MTKRRNNMKDINPNQYTLAKKFKEGHRYFWFKSANYTGGFGGDRLAIVDDSGDYPHLTDDGLLFVYSTPIITTVYGGRPTRTTASIPLIDIDGETSSTSSSIYEAFGVAKLLGLPIKITDPHGDGEPIEVQWREIK
jgi:hypothetical protein